MIYRDNVFCVDRSVTLKKMRKGMTVHVFEPVLKGENKNTYQKLIRVYEVI